MTSTILQNIGQRYAAYVAAVERAKTLLAQGRCTPAEEKELFTVVACLEADQSTRDLLAAEQRRALAQVLEETSRYASPAAVAIADDYLRLENIICRDADGKVFEQYPELYVRKDVFKDAAGNIVYFTTYNGAAHAEQCGDFAPSMALSCNILAALFQDAVEKKRNKYVTKDAALEQVLQQYKEKGNGNGGHRQNTLVNLGTLQIIHYPIDSDFPSNGGTQNVNVPRPKTILGFDKMGFADKTLEEALQVPNYARYVKNLTGLSDPSVLVDIGQYFGKPAKVWVSSSDETRAVWLGCDYDGFDLDAGYFVYYAYAVRGVRSSLPRSGARKTLSTGPR